VETDPPVLCSKQAASSGQAGKMLMDIGAELRAAREAKGLSLGSLAQRTRVQPRTLAAIEINDIAAIPPRPFGRGFVRAYAQEVSLDPERTVQNYFSQFPATQEPPAQTPRIRTRVEPDIEPPSHWAGLGTAFIILMAVVGVAVAVGRRNDAGSNATPPASVSPAVIGTSGGAAGADRAAPAAPPAAVTEAIQAAAQPAAPPLRLSFAVTRECWVAAMADGERAIYRLVQPGEKLTVDAKREIDARFGDAGAVTWTINGKPGASLGDAGAVRNVHCRLPNGDCQFN
jgi:cytoskeleton protein RodZ